MFKGIFPFAQIPFGNSLNGISLTYVPAKEHAEFLVFAGIHGEEAETIFLLSRAMRFLTEPFKHVAVVLCLNPDGILLGTRGNARGVDLNRNFPTSDWKKSAIYARPYLEAPREMELYSGDYAASEPETKALLSLIDKLNVPRILALHAPLGCIDTPYETTFSKALEKCFHLPSQSGVGYKTPGSFGTWCLENNKECVTLELPRVSGEEIVRDYALDFANLLSAL